ncbi:thiol peroxidase [Candidatus Dependentiae bacterium]|nr:thiol peroxidase [Candidatus Dependentiae bacterium]
MNFSEIMLNRRSVNFFKKDIEIDNNVLKNIIDFSALSPSASNTQPWKLIIVNDSESKKKLRSAAFDQPKITDASATFIVLGDTEAYKPDNPAYKFLVKNKYIEQEQLPGMLKMIEGLYSNLHKPEHYAIRNASLFAMSIMYSAKMYNWDTHPMIGFNPDSVKKIFNIPDRFIPVMLIAIGKFDDSKVLLKRNERLSSDDISSFNKFEFNQNPNFNNIFTEESAQLTLKGTIFHLVGKIPEKFSQAPDFYVFDNNLKKIKLIELLNKPLIISSVPSLDTPVCSLQTKKFNDILKEYNDKINFVSISCDTPFAQKRFCSESSISFPALSDHKDNNFSLNYGLLISELRLCARSVFIISNQKKIEYIQLVKEISNEPDYSEVINEIKRIVQ